MTKTHISRPATLALLLALLGASVGCLPSPTPQSSAWHGVVVRDCAPWDGAAFTLSIPLDTGRLLIVSVFQAPDLRRSTTFTFPDPTGRLGNAVYRPEPGMGADETLTGTITFQAVQAGLPVQGQMHLNSTSSGAFNGSFTAEWGNTTAYCG
jgi:hypothetical protein